MFGRRKREEDPFAALKDGVTYQSSPITVPDIGVGLGGDSRDPQAQPQPPASPSAGTRGQAPTPLQPPQPSGLGSAVSYGGASRMRRSGLGAVPARTLSLVVIALAAIALPVLGVSKGGHSASTPSPPFGSSPGSTATPGHGHVSYLSPAGVRAGIAHLRRVVPGARVVLFRIDAKSLSATAVGAHGAAKEVYFGPAGTLVTSAPATGERPIPLSQVRPAVVARLVAEMGHRFHVPPRRIDYMVISSPPGLPPQWIVFSTAPSHPGFGAMLSGAGLHRL